jgi:hypothetical protein
MEVCLLETFFAREEAGWCEADNSPQSNAKVKDVCSYASTSPYVFLA